MTDFITTLQSSAVQTTLAVSALIAFILLVRRPFAKRFGANAAYALWAIPLIRLVMPPLPANWTLFGALAPAKSPEPTVSRAPQEIILTSPEGAAADAVLIPPVAPPAPALSAVQAGPSFDLWQVAGPLFGLLWIFGAVLAFCWALQRQRQFHDLIDADSDAPSQRLQRLADTIARGMGLKTTPAIRMSLLCSGPLVTGAARPIVLLPAWFEADYAPEEQTNALTHEFMHVRRGDLWALHAANAFLALQWFNPLAYIARRAFRADQEAACDADVLARRTTSPQSYGRTLVKAATLARTSDRAFAGASLTLGHPIKERLVLMQNPTPTFSRRLTGGALAASCGAFALLATASFSSSAQELDGATQEDERTREEDRRERRIIHRSDRRSDKTQMVILGDPFPDLDEKLSSLGDLDFDMDFEFDLSDMPQLDWGDMDFSIDLEGLGELEGLAGLAQLGFALQGDEVKISINGEDFLLPRDEEAFEARIELWAEGFETRAEAWAEANEGRIEAWAEAFEAKMEAWAERQESFEARAEAIAARVEARFDSDFTDAIEAGAEAVEELADQCDARDPANLDPEIVSVVNSETGDTLRALCLNGPKDRLGADEIEGFVRANPRLSAAEKDAFFNNRDDDVEIDIRIERD